MQKGRLGRIRDGKAFQRSTDKQENRVPTCCRNERKNASRKFISNKDSEKFSYLTNEPVSARITVFACITWRGIVYHPTEGLPGRINDAFIIIQTRPNYWKITVRFIWFSRLFPLIEKTKTCLQIVKKISRNLEKLSLKSAIYRKLPPRKYTYTYT